LAAIPSLPPQSDSVRLWFRMLKGREPCQQTAPQ
jgi:hypothetical protein